jgi:hypothetical protein
VFRVYPITLDWALSSMILSINNKNNYRMNDNDVYYYFWSFFMLLMPPLLLILRGFYIRKSKPERSGGYCLVAIIYIIIGFGFCLRFD